MPLNRVRKLQVLKRLGKRSQDMINMSINRNAENSGRLLRINNMKNAVNSLNAVKSGRLTNGKPLTVEEIMQKIKSNEDYFGMYRLILEENLAILGYAELLRKKGMATALKQYYAEHEAAVRKNASREKK